MTIPAPVPLRRTTPPYAMTPAYAGRVTVTCEWCGWQVSLDQRFAASTMGAHGRVLGDGDPTVPACPTVHPQLPGAAA